MEETNEVADVQSETNTDNLQIVPEEKWPIQHDLSLKDYRLENMKIYLKFYSSNERLSQPILSCFKETSYAAKPISKFQRKNMPSENQNENLITLATNDFKLKKEEAIQEIPQLKDKDGIPHYLLMRDEKETEDRTVPESFVNIIKNEAKSSVTHKSKTDSGQEPLESQCYSAEWNKKWENIQRFITEQRLVYNGSAGDLVSSIHKTNYYFPMHTKTRILKSLSQPRASVDEDFIYKKHFVSSKCICERTISSKTATTNVAVSSSAQNWHWKDTKENVKEQQWSYSGCAGDLLYYPSGMGKAKPILKGSLSQPTKYVDNKWIKEAMVEENCTLKVSQEFSFSNHYVIKNVTNENKKMPPSIMITAEETEDFTSLKTAQVNNSIENPNVSLKTLNEELTVHSNNDVESKDVLNVSRNHSLIHTKSCKMLKEQVDNTEDQTVPNEVNTTDECSRNVHNTDSPVDAGNNSEYKRFSPDVFADKDDVSLYSDSLDTVPAVNTFLNIGTKETADITLNSEDKYQQKNEHELNAISHGQASNDISTSKPSQNVLGQLEAKEKCLSIQNDKNNAVITRVEKTIDFTTFEDESVIDDVDCLCESDMFPMCLSQPAIPTYLVSYCSPEMSQNNSKILTPDMKVIERCSEQSYQEIAENTTESFSNTHIKNGCEGSCKDLTCASSASNSLYHQTCDTDAYEDFLQKTSISIHPNSDASFEENIQIGVQDGKMQTNDKIRKCNTESNRVNAENKQPQNKSGHNYAEKKCETLHIFYPTLENDNKTDFQTLRNHNSVASDESYHPSKSIENQLVSKGNMLFTAEPAMQLNSYNIPVVLNNESVLEKKIHIEKTDIGYPHKKTTNVSNDTQDNQIVPIYRISESKNSVNTTKKVHSINISIAHSIEVDENCKFYSDTLIINHSRLTQQSSSNGKYLDIAETLCNEYSLSSAKHFKNNVTNEELKAKYHKEMYDYEDSISEEHGSDVSIYETTSESNIDLHIDDAIEKYQCVSPGRDATLLSDSQNMSNYLEASVQTYIHGLVHAEQCICKKFNFHCELCNGDSTEMSENTEKRKHAKSSDSEMPLNKKAKCCNQKTHNMTSSDNNFETDNKTQSAESTKYTENIKAISQLSCFNKNTPPPPKLVTYNYVHRDEHQKQPSIQDTQLFNWPTMEKGKSAQKPQEINEQEQQNPKPRVPLRIGLSKRAKTKRLHCCSN